MATERSELSLISDTEWDLFYEIAKKAADAAGEIICRYYGKKLKFNDKNGDGPVTMADKEAEEAMVSIILQNFPSHAVFGEETGWRNLCKSAKDEKNPSSAAEGTKPEFVWVLDPIDGTTSFIAGIPLFGTLIALLYKGKPILGCIDQPVTRLRWMGIKGRRTTLNGEEISTEACSGLGQAYTYLKGPNYNDDAKYAFDRIVYKVLEAFFDGNCMAYGHLASGQLHAVIDCGLDPFDFLALIPVVEGAGGVITDWQGQQLHWDMDQDYLSSIPEGGFRVVAAGDNRTHQQIVDELSPA